MAAALRPLRQTLRRLARPRHKKALPVQLDRQRIYVLPTRFGLFYAVLVLAMLVGALNYNNNPALLLALVLAGTGLASVFGGHRQLSGLRITALEASPVAAGQPLPLQVHVRCDALPERQGLMLSLPGISDEPAPLPVHGGRGRGSLPLPTRRRGWLAVPRIRIACTRPLGLALCWAWLRPQQSLLVYPAPEVDGPPLPPSRALQGRGQPQRGGEDMHHLREYRRGDARHVIAWKPSARHGALLVREHEQPQGDQLRLDWDALHALAPEARIRRLAHWVDLATRQDCRFRLLLPGQTIGPDAGPAHRHACLRALALLPGAAADNGSADD